MEVQKIKVNADLILTFQSPKPIEGKNIDLAILLAERELNSMAPLEFAEEPEALCAVRVHVLKQISVY